MPTYASSFGEVFFEKWGSGQEAVLYIPGMGLAHDYTAAFCQLLSQQYTVVSYDHPEIGQSKNARLPLHYSLYAICDLLMGILQTLKINKFHVIGESYGGNIAFGMAIRYGEKVLSQTLVSSSYTGCRYPRLSPMAVVANAKSLLTKRDRWDEDLPQRLFSKATLNHRPDLVREWLQINQKKRLSLSTCHKQMLAIATFDVKSQLRHIKCKTLIVYGGDDRLVPNKNSLLLAKQINNPCVEMLPDAGHHLCFEKRQEVANLFFRFTP